ncbi:MAG: permease [Acidimicrobiia bacterium]
MEITPARSPARRPERSWFAAVARPETLLLVLVAAVVLRPHVADVFDRPALQNFSTVFVAVCIQAMPFLVLGVVISGALVAFVSHDTVTRVVPKHPAIAVPVAGLAGAALPGCECSAVPIAGRLVAQGAPPAAALTFLLSSPAINPVVLVATSVAFPNRPVMVVARFVASLVASIVVGLIWTRIGRDDWVSKARSVRPVRGSRLATLGDVALHDFLHAGGYLVLGAITAALLQTVVPRSVLDSIGSNAVVAVVALGVLAVVLAICSEADAFVATGLTQFSWTARLVFLTVGPMVDLKLIALQVGTFGRPFALRFAPLTFVVAVASASIVGWWLL